MTRTLSQLIDEQLGLGAETSPAPQAASRTAAPAAATDLADEAEKVASVLEYVVQSGALRKVAAAGGSMPETDANKPMPKGTINLLATNRRTSHPAFASTAAATAATKGDVARENTPALQAAFAAKPYADPVTDQVLAHRVDHRDVNARLQRAKAEKARRSR